MFFTAGDKFSGKIFGDWETRLIAVDCSRRYMYYSEAVSYPLHFEYHIEPDNYCGQKAKWRKKFKLTAVTSLTVERRVNYASPTFVPNDLLQLEFEGEERPIAPGEIPPAGPLVHPTADLSPYDKKLYAIGNDNFLKDPFGLIDLYQGTRDLFANIKLEREMKVAAAAREGKTISIPDTATYQSPRASGGQSSSKKTIKVVFRSRDEREFRRLWYVVQTILGYDKLIIRPFRGLPPYDPRNGVAFSHIPMALWHEFKGLDTAVMYCFTIGDVVTVSKDQTELQTMLKNVAMIITHDTVYFMRNSRQILRWIRLQDVNTFQYNTTSNDPFVAFLCARPVPDTVFIPRKDEEFNKDPLIGLDFHAALQVHRIRRVLHDSCFASLSVRRVFNMEENWDHSAVSYINKKAKEGHPLCMMPGEGFNYAINCPLPKEQLAAVWYAVQAQLRALGRLPNSAAIPLYGSNAAELQLSEAQLNSVAAYLNGQREHEEDIVGISLDAAQRVTSTPSENQTSQGASPASRTSPTTAAPPSPPPAKKMAPRRFSSSQLVDELRTPLITVEDGNPLGADNRNRDSRSSRSKSVSSGSEGGEESDKEANSYGEEDARYFTAEEVKNSAVEISKEEHIVIATTEENATETPFMFQPSLEAMLERSVEFYLNKNNINNSRENSDSFPKEATKKKKATNESAGADSPKKAKTDSESKKERESKHVDPTLK